MRLSTEQLADEVTVWKRQTLLGVSVFSRKEKGRRRKRRESRHIYGFRDEQEKLKGWRLGRNF